MSAYSVTSVDELTNTLLEQESSACVCIERGASDDVACALTAKAHQLKDAGKKVRIVCPDATSARRYRVLAAQNGLESSDVLTVRELALGIMADQRIQKAVGRDARLIDENEHDVLMEDVKVSGLKPGRLREMLKFFYKSISDIADEQDGWLVTSEEQTVHAILVENLEVRRAMLPCELPSMAYRGLVDANAKREPLALIVDDYGSLSKASQRLVRYLATEGLVTVGSAYPAANAEEPYPYYDGFSELAEACDATISLQTGRSVAPRRSASLESPEEEFDYVAATVFCVVSSGIEAHDVLVAVPNRTWAKQIEKALAVRGIDAVYERDSTKIAGDPRTDGRYGDLKLATFLRLFLDPSDLTALRSWLGFGDWLLRSDAFLELMAYARDHDESVADALASLRTIRETDRTTMAFGKLDAPLDELADLMAACGDIGCAETVALFEAHGMPLSPSMVELLGDDAAHADIENLARNAFSAPSYEGESSLVTIAPYRSCHGRVARVTIITGLVNGFLPALDAVDDKYTVDHRRVAYAREHLLFLDLLSTARDEVVCTRFEHDRLENASVLHMQTARVFVKGGTRYAAIQPSEFADAPDEALSVPDEIPRELPTKVLYASSTL